MTDKKTIIDMGRDIADAIEPRSFEDQVFSALSKRIAHDIDDMLVNEPGAWDALGAVPLHSSCRCTISHPQKESFDIPVIVSDAMPPGQVAFVTRDIFEQVLAALPNRYQAPRMPVMSERDAKAYREFLEGKEQEQQEERRSKLPKTRKIRLPRYKEK